MSQAGNTLSEVQFGFSYHHKMRCILFTFKSGRKFWPGGKGLVSFYFYPFSMAEVPQHWPL